MHAALDACLVALAVLLQAVAAPAVAAALVVRRAAARRRIGNLAREGLNDTRTMQQALVGANRHGRCLQDASVRETICNAVEQ